MGETDDRPFLGTCDHEAIILHGFAWNRGLRFLVCGDHPRLARCRGRRATSDIGAGASTLSITFAALVVLSLLQISCVATSDSSALWQGGFFDRVGGSLPLGLAR